jgi:dolichol-phosphate mannosyltransferase
MEKPFISIVAPCFNEEEVLPEFYRRAKAVCDKLQAPHEIVLVNDGSRDHTWETMEQISAKDSSVVCVNLSRNHGHQLALSAGLTVCNGERILVIDADLQDPPELLPQMLDLMDRGAEVVYGQRRARAGETWFKRITAAAFYRILESLTETKIPRDTGDFRLMSRRAVNVLTAMPERHRFIRGMVSWIGFNQKPLLYDRDARYAGETKYPLRRMFRLSLDAITSFSIKPLALASLVGVVAAALSVFLLLFTLASWLTGGNAAGWTSLMAAMTFIASLQFILLGIHGEYLGRLYEQSKERPLFIIEGVYRRPAVVQPDIRAALGKGTRKAG